MALPDMHDTCVIRRSPVDLASCDVLAVRLYLLQVGRPQLQPVDAHNNNKVDLGRGLSYWHVATTPPGCVCSAGTSLAGRTEARPVCDPHND